MRPTAGREEPGAAAAHLPGQPRQYHPSACRFPRRAQTAPFGMTIGPGRLAFELSARSRTLRSFGRQDAGDVSRKVCRSTNDERISSVIDQPSQHVPNMVLSAEKHCQNTYGFVFCIDLEPVNCAIDGQVP